MSEIEKTLEKEPRVGESLRHEKPLPTRGVSGKVLLKALLRKYPDIGENKSPASSEIKKAVEKETLQGESLIHEKPLPVRGVTEKALLHKYPKLKGEKSPESLKKNNPHIIGFTKEDAPLTEQYRKLRSLLVSMTQKQSTRNTIMITSSESGEGKSLTAINLALVLAQGLNHTVLLIDADFRRPTLQSYLGLDPALGLSDCLANNIDVGQALVKTGIAKLSFLSAGKKTEVPAELLSSIKMKELIHELKHRYHDRYIIIDTAPTLMFSETHALSAFVDGILLVVKEGTTTSSVRDALVVLKDSPLLGIVYNGANMEQDSGYYYKYYRSYNR
jgi:protein-tyrosine kinase